jgi:hypothetical protein
MAQLHGLERFSTVVPATEFKFSYIPYYNTSISVRFFRFAASTFSTELTAANELKLIPIQ